MSVLAHGHVDLWGLEIEVETAILILAAAVGVLASALVAVATFMWKHDRGCIAHNTKIDCDMEQVKTDVGEIKSDIKSLMEAKWR